jgi:hypothetical protein
LSERTAFAGYILPCMKKKAKKKQATKKSATKKTATKTAKKAVKKAKKAVKKPAKTTTGKVGTCDNWTAVHDFMPPGPARLRVHGVCTFPTPGYQVILKRAVPQGINPAILILDKTVKRPTGIEPQIVTKVDARFEETTNTNYTEVHIRPDGVQIRVTIVS